MISNDEIRMLVGDACYEMYERLDEYIAAFYQMEATWSNGGKYGRYCLRYQRSKKTLCTLYLRENQLGIWVILGKTERDKFEAAAQQFSPEVNDKYRQTETFHDGKWLMFDAMDATLLEDIKKLLLIKRKPKKAN